MNLPHPVDRRTFFKNRLGCAACVAVAGVPAAFAAAEPAGPSPEQARAATVHDWLTEFVTREEKNLDRAALVKLLEQRGRLCCARLDFRQQMIAEAGGDVNKLVGLMGQRVGPENCRREGNTVTLVYPVERCVCGWNPQREPSPGDPFCECSKANNQRIFEVVSGRPVKVQVTDSPRRNGKPCRFVIELG